jgi:hypothetical protein
LFCFVSWPLICFCFVSFRFWIFSVFFVSFIKPYGLIFQTKLSTDFSSMLRCECVGLKQSKGCQPIHEWKQTPKDTKMSPSGSYFSFSTNSIVLLSNIPDPWKLFQHFHQPFRRCAVVVCTRFLPNSNLFIIRFVFMTKMIFLSWFSSIYNCYL